MDFNIVKRQIMSEYLKQHGSYCNSEEWSVRACINVFRYYYERYREVFRKDHPHISSDTVSWILEALPVARSEDGDELYLSPDEYPQLIDAHFETKYSRCNYSIAHFMTGKIRFLKYYEAVY